MKENLKIEYIAKKSLLNEKTIDRMNIETVLEWMTYYLTNIDILWKKASIEVKHRIQKSIFPEKITFDEKTLRTPNLGYAYKLNELFEAQKSSKYSIWKDVRTYLASLDPIERTALINACKYFKYKEI